MKLIVGLSNPGKKYQNTRHNVGKIVVKTLKNLISNPEVSFATPEIFINNSGEAVRNLVKKRNIDLDDLLVVHDDIDLDFGAWKLQKGRGAAGHHGVESVIDHLGSKDFWRLRIGIGRPKEAVKSHNNYVVSKLTKQELEELDRLTQSNLAVAVKNWTNGKVS